MVFRYLFLSVAAITLRSGQISISSNQVSQQVSVTLSIFRATQGPLWQPNQCFQLNVQSPYQNSIYTPFISPICSSLTQGLTVNCASNTTLQFYFTNVSVSAANQQSVQIQTTMLTPFSAQPLNNIYIEAYSDINCTQDRQSFWFNTLTIQPAMMQHFKVNSSSNWIGDKNATLSLSFQSQLARNGRIELGLPTWWQVNQISDQMFSSDSYCESDCFDVTSQGLQGSSLIVKYTQLRCLSLVTMQCFGFKNPVYQDVWYGFFVNSYDSEQTPALIEKSDVTFLDASSYQPFQISSRNLIIQSSNTQIQQFSEWQLQLQPGIPLMQHCYITISFPPELSIKINQIQASGIFIPPSLNHLLTTSDYQQSGQRITFNGCNDINSLGSAPSGSLYISNIQTPMSVQTTGPIKVTIYRDELMMQQIGVLQPKFIDAADLQPGTLQNAHLTPVVTTVQMQSYIWVNFTTSDTIPAGSKLIISLPSGLTVFDKVDIVGLPTTGLVPSTPAKTAKVQNNTVSIENFAIYPTSGQFWFMILSVVNQQATRDAGSWSIQIQDNNNNLIDFLYSNQSFIATPGTATGQLSLNTYQSKQLAIYNFTIQLQSPKLSFVQITFPTAFNLSQSNCENCTIKNNTVICQKPNLVIKNVKNPRSTEPSQVLQVLTLDSQMFVIDKGIIPNIQTTPDFIQLFNVTPVSLVNGELTDYKFYLNDDFLATDVLVFTVPKQISLSLANCKTCQISGQLVKLPFEPNFVIHNVRNPGSTITSDGFENVAIYTNTSWIVAIFQGAANITTTTAGIIANQQLIQDSLLPRDNTTYTLLFLPLNKVPQNGSFQVECPPSIIIREWAKCIVTTTQVFSQNCLIKNNVITVTNVFLQDFSAQITLAISNVTNPFQNTDTTPIKITTYADPHQKYVIDMSEQLIPMLICDYPCKTCISFKDRTQCTACYQPMLLQNSSCVDSCSSGWTQNNQELCSPCDSSCASCENNGGANNYLECTKCSVQFPYAQGNRCFKECNPGYFKSSNLTCQPCNKNCYSCSEQEICTSCIFGKQLFAGQCIDECPIGMTAIDGVCQSCEAPCAQCIYKLSICKSCETSLLLFRDKCYSQCPAGSFEKYNTCHQCDLGCQLCDSTQCLQCQDPLIIVNGTCQNLCSDGSKPDMLGQCQTGAVSQDMSVLQYPFLISAIILTVTVLFGKLKKKATLVQGQLVYISTQKSVTAILAMICPLQCLLTISYWAEAAHFQSYGQLIIVLLLFLIQIGLNLLQLRSLFQLKPLKYIKKHCIVYYTACGFAILHIYAMKLLQSHFYQFDMFKAEQVTFAKWVWVAYYLILAAVGVWGASTTQPESQLFISQIESVVLSCYTIILIFCEKKIVQQKIIPKVNQKLKLQIKLTNPFQNTKLEHLLELFGNRKCRSTQNFICIKEEDPRRVKTWCATPKEFQNTVLLQEDKCIQAGEPDVEFKSQLKQSYQGMQLIESSECRPRKSKRGRPSICLQPIDSEQEHNEFEDLLQQQQKDEEQLRLIVQQSFCTDLNKFHLRIDQLSNVIAPSGSEQIGKQAAQSSRETRRSVAVSVRNVNEMVNWQESDCSSQQHSNKEVLKDLQQVSKGFNQEVHEFNPWEMQDKGIWLTDQVGNIVDRLGNKVIDQSKLVDGEIILQNYDGSSFNLKHCLDSNGRFLLDEEGNIITNQGAVLFKHSQLVNGSFTKIFARHCSVSRMMVEINEIDESFEDVFGSVDRNDFAIPQQKQDSRLRNESISNDGLQRSQQPTNQVTNEMIDFYGQDLQRFLDDPEWDIESLDNISISEKSITGHNLSDCFVRSMENQFLAKVRPVSRLRSTPFMPKHQKKQIGGRSTLLQTTDDPGVIHHGNQQEFNL